MPALTFSQIAATLGTYVEPDGDFKASLNQVLARMYSMGTYRDFTVQYSLPVVDSAVTLPEDCDSVLHSMVDGNPSPVRSLWHDYKAIGLNRGADPSWGLMDSGYFPTTRNLSEATRVFFVLPSVYQNAGPAFSATDGSQIEIVGTDGNQNYWASASTDKDVMVISGTLIDTLGNTLETPIFLYNAGTNEGKSYWTDDGSVSSLNRLVWELGSPNTWSLALANGNYIASSTTDSATPEGLTFVEVMGTGVPTVSAYPTILFPLAINSIASVRFDGLTASYDLLTDPSDSASSIAKVGPDSGICRFRRFRISRSTDGETTVHVLCKRAFIPLQADDDIVHCGNIGAMKQGLLARIAEDSADLERAEYHWQRCALLLEEEAASSRGAAIPRLNVDVYGTGGLDRISQMY